MTDSPTKPALSVSFHNFWRRFDAKNSFFVKALAERFSVSVERVGRDVQIGSVFGDDQLPNVRDGRPLRVWWTGEAKEPQDNLYDLHFGFRRTPLLGRRWHRFPLWINYLDWWNPQSPYHVDRLLVPRVATDRPRFCNFIYGHATSIRTEFFLRLNEARHVDSRGRVLANGPRAIGLEGKMRVLEQSQFTIAFENQVAPGYVTEKLVEPLLAGSIPIYWGAAEARSDFNPGAFIFADDHGGIDDLVRHVLRVADSAEARTALMSAPPFRDGRIPEEHTPGFFADRIAEALSGAADVRVPQQLANMLIDKVRVGRRIERGIRRIRKAAFARRPG